MKGSGSFELERPKLELYSGSKNPARSAPLREGPDQQFRGKKKVNLKKLANPFVQLGWITQTKELRNENRNCRDGTGPSRAELNLGGVEPEQAQA